MNFYDFHIGDYASRTAHLEPMEDLAYRRLLDLYYVREEPLPWDVADIARLIRLRGQEDAIKAVLKEFFVPSEGEGWLHQKCEKVISAAQIKRGKAQASANKRWHSEGNANAMPTDCEGNAPSPSPSPSPQKKSSAAALLSAEGIPEDLALDFLEMRKTQKATFTRTALAGFVRESAKAGMSLEEAIRTSTERSWRGFKAEWLTDAKAATAGRHTDRAEETQRMLADQNKHAAPMPAFARELADKLTGKKAAA